MMPHTSSKDQWRASYLICLVNLDVLLSQKQLYHFMMPFVEDYREVRVRPETFTMEPIKAITKDGIENTFREITAITTIKKDKIITMTKQFGVDFKNVLVFDRIKENLR